MLAGQQCRSPVEPSCARVPRNYWKVVPFGDRAWVYRKLESSHRGTAVLRPQRTGTVSRMVVNARMVSARRSRGLGRQTGPLTVHEAGDGPAGRTSAASCTLVCVDVLG